MGQTLINERQETEKEAEPASKFDSVFSGDFTCDLESILFSWEAVTSLAMPHCLCFPFFLYSFPFSLSLFPWNNIPNKILAYNKLYF